MGCRKHSVLCTVCWHSEAATCTVTLQGLRDKSGHGERGAGQTHVAEAGGGGRGPEAPRAFESLALRRPAQPHPCPWGPRSSTGPWDEPSPPGSRPRVLLTAAPEARGMVCAPSPGLNGVPPAWLCGCNTSYLPTSHKGMEAAPFLLRFLLIFILFLLF